MNSGMGSVNKGMGSMNMGTGSTAVPPLKRYRCMKCGMPFLHKSQYHVTCPHCRNVQCGQKAGTEK